MQKDLDDYMKLQHGKEQPGQAIPGRTPYETFVEGREKEVPIFGWEPEVETNLH